MPQLTAEQLTELGKTFLSFANAVDEYRMENQGQLSAGQNKTLKDLHKELCRYSDDFFASSTIALGSEVETSLQTVKEITKQIGATYNKLKNVQKAIDLAAAGVALGAAIFSRSPEGVKEAVAGLVETVKKES
jgi:hypothetical protein